MSSIATAPAEHPTTIYFDGSCPLCRNEIAYYKSCGGKDRLAFVDVSGPGAARLAPDLDRTSAMKRFHVRRSDGKIVSGAMAFATVWQQIPQWRWAGRIFALPGPRHVADLAYLFYLRYRPGLQAWEKVLEAHDIKRRQKALLIETSKAGMGAIVPVEAQPAPQSAARAAAIAASTMPDAERRS
jgi:predicted DCC family thiol-disulfide oxidoreductase YuxK